MFARRCLFYCSIIRVIARDLCRVYYGNAVLRKRKVPLTLGRFCKSSVHYKRPSRGDELGMPSSSCEM